MYADDTHIEYFLSNPLKLSIDNFLIGQVSLVKLRGIFFDENLQWQTHHDKLPKKFASGIGATKGIMYQFNYCNLVCGNCGKTLFCSYSI